MASFKLETSARSAFRTAAIIFVTTMAMSLVRPLVELIFDRHWYYDWKASLVVATIFSAGYFLLLFLYTFFHIGRAEQLDDILVSGGVKLPAFVAMEYYFLFLNRSFLVFIAEDALYGWKFQGAVTNRDIGFFIPWQGLAEDPAYCPSVDGLKRLSAKRGNFYIERATIKSAEYDPTPKWGMGGIPHSGKIRIRLQSGRKRELILLGSVSGSSILQQILGSTVLKAGSTASR